MNKAMAAALAAERRPKPRGLKPARWPASLRDVNEGEVEIEMVADGERKLASAVRPAGS